MNQATNQRKKIPQMDHEMEPLKNLKTVVARSQESTVSFRIANDYRGALYIHFRIDLLNFASSRV